MADGAGDGSRVDGLLYLPEAERCASAIRGMELDMVVVGLYAVGPAKCLKALLGEYGGVPLRLSVA